MTARRLKKTKVGSISSRGRTVSVDRRKWKEGSSTLEECE